MQQTCTAKSTRIFKKLVSLMCSYVNLGTKDRPGVDVWAPAFLRYSSTTSLQSIELPLHYKQHVLWFMCLKFLCPYPKFSSWETISDCFYQMWWIRHKKYWRFFFTENIDGLINQIFAWSMQRKHATVLTGSITSHWHHCQPRTSETEYRLT